jgi:hypothetical protein
MYSRLQLGEAYLTHWLWSCKFGGICPAGTRSRKRSDGPLVPKLPHHRGRKADSPCCKRFDAQG